MHTVPPLNRSIVECCKCCKIFDNFAKSSMGERAVLQMAGLRFERIKSSFCDIRAGLFHRVCGALLCLCCEACCGTPVQHCEQRSVGQLQSARNSEIIFVQVIKSNSENRSSVFCRIVEVQFFLDKLDFNFSKIRVTLSHREVLIYHVATVSHPPGNERSFVFNGLLCV